MAFGDLITGGRAVELREQQRDEAMECSDLWDSMHNTYRCVVQEVLHAALVTAEGVTYHA